MADIEKVIKALEFCTDTKPVETCFGKCPYAVADDDYRCRDMKLDALELLKEQKPVEAEVEIEGGGHNWFYVCGECHGFVKLPWVYCPGCGRRLKWVQLN